MVDVSEEATKTFKLIKSLTKKISQVNGVGRKTQIDALEAEIVKAENDWWVNCKDAFIIEPDYQERCREQVLRGITKSEDIL